MELKLSKTEFIEIIEDVKKANDYQTGLNQYFKAHDTDGYIFQPDCSCTVINLLHLFFGELDCEEFISLFCFELDFGRKWKPGMVTAVNGTDLKLSNAEELYDYLACPHEKEHTP